jgi:hypothetical protein
MIMDDIAMLQDVAGILTSQFFAPHARSRNGRRLMRGPPVAVGRP